MYIACHAAMCIRVIIYMASSHYNMAWYSSQAADGKRFNRPRATWGKNHHCGVLHILPATFKALGFFKVLHSLSFWWKITKPGHNFLETEYFVTNSLFWTKRIKGFFWGGGRTFSNFWPVIYDFNLNKGFFIVNETWIHWILKKL